MSPPILLNPIPAAKGISRRSRDFAFFATILLQAALIFLAGHLNIDKPDTARKPVRTAIHFMAAAPPAPEPAPVKPTVQEKPVAPEPVREIAPVTPSPEPVVETPVKEAPKPVVKETPTKAVPKKPSKPKPEPKPVVKKPKKKVPKKIAEKRRPKPVRKPKPKVEPVTKKIPDTPEVKAVEKKAATPPPVTEKAAASSPQPVNRPAPAAKAPAPVAPPAPSTEVSEAKNADLLLAALTAMIERYKKYPRAAQRARLEGDVRVKVVVDGAGTLKRFDLLESSGHKILDKATLKIFKRIAGKRIAANEMKRALEIVVPVRYVRR